MWHFKHRKAGKFVSVNVGYFDSSSFPPRRKVCFSVPQYNHLLIVASFKLATTNRALLDRIHAGNFIVTHSLALFSSDSIIAMTKYTDEHSPPKQVRKTGTKILKSIASCIK